MDAKAKKAAYMRQYRVKNPDKMRSIELKKHYGITLEDYNTVLAEQGGCCAVCGKLPGVIGTGNKSVGTLAVDHCHSTGTVRGLLCTNCNLGIGSFFEDAKLLRNALAYIEAHQELVARLIAERSRQQAEAQVIAEKTLAELMK